MSTENTNTEELKTITAQDLKEYVYKDGVKSEIPGDLHYALITILEQVVENETVHNAFLYTYPEKSKKIFNKDNKEVLEKVETEWKDYPTAQSFFDQTPVKAMSVLGAMAEDLLLLLREGHLDNISKGLTNKIGTFAPKEDSDVKL
jgi:hypothetical protein